jgi:hypothetical protein
MLLQQTKQQAAHHKFLMALDIPGRHNTVSEEMNRSSLDKLADPFRYTMIRQPYPDGKEAYGAFVTSDLGRRKQSFNKYPQPEAGLTEKIAENRLKKYLAKQCSAE